MSEETKQKPYIAHVEGNLKRGARHKLGEKTLIVGMNGAGKTSIVNCIEFALTSGCSDVAGRDWVADKSQINSLAPDEKTRPHAVVTTSTGSTISGAAMNPAAIFPVRGLLDKLAGTSDVFRRDVMGPALSHLIPLSDVFALLAREDGLMFEEMRDKALPPLSALTKAAKDAKAHAKTLRGNVEGLHDALRTIASTRPAQPVSSANVVQLRDQLAAAEEAAAAEARANQEAVAVYQQSVRTMSDLQAQWQAHRAQLHQQIAALSARAAQLRPAVDPSVVALLDAISLLAGRLHERNASNCGICGGTLAPGRAAEVVGQAAQSKAAMMAAPPEVAEIQQQVEEIRPQIAQADETLAKIQAEINAIPRPTSQNAAATRRDQIAYAIQSTQAELARAEQAHSEDAAKREQALRDQIASKSAQVDRHDRFATAALEASAAVADRQMTALIERVQKRIPAGMGEFHVDLSQHHVRWGLRRGAAFHTALSESERAIVATSFASVLQEIAGGGGFICRPILIPPDRQITAPTLGAMMSVLEEVDAQVIILSTVKPIGRPRAGWTVIDLSEPQGDGGGKATKTEAATATTTSAPIFATPTEAPHGLASLAPPMPEASAAPVTPSGMFASSTDLETAWAFAVGGEVSPVAEVREVEDALIWQHENGAVTRLDAQGATVIAPEYDGRYGESWRRAA